MGRFGPMVQVPVAMLVIVAVLYAFHESLLAIHTGTTVSPSLR